MNELTTLALCPTRAKIAAAMTSAKPATIEWKPTASSAMRANTRPYGTGWMTTWSVAVAMTKDGRPATGRDAAATLHIAVAHDAMGRWSASLTPGQEEGERPLTLEGSDGGYPAAQAAVAGAMSDYAKSVIGKRRGYVPTALRSTLGGGDLIRL